ncbi:sodium-dependent transporter [Campylobacter volucris]|uniref:Sodium-dependent transporter n=1 Tax=Campylobacter volucris TaxID=1031542 RepID=A0AAE5YH04_9BACT|nr:sodium-dependent transporter [Campylobacter volucris]AJC94478.1 Na+-dependent transporter, SNF family [Campylobacter volucris LMG 24379]KAB0578960.1 sodium-dependent transporter [Campylobacter volucris]QBL13167.1 sodium-dependent transporter [Campylobacter volucris]QEL08695.1 sodium-dependent transporter, SNF family [Campylobacter volucris]TXK71350.1 sodium-dependent transporter [Campylobacter volucris]
MNDKFSKIGFILAVAGSAVGLGNAWKFPTLVGNNGGSAFVIVYLLLTIGVAFVIFLAELSIGKLSEKDPVNAYHSLAPKNKKAWSWAGFFMLGAIILVSFYSVVIGWIVKYAYLGFFTLPSNTDEAGAIFGNLLSKDVLSQFICFTFVFIVIFYVVSKGVKSGIEKLNVWMMPSLFILLILMLGYSFSMDGFSKASEFLFSPDFSKLSVSSILDALGLAFFSMSLGVCVILTYAASLPDKTNFISSAFNIIIINTIIGIIMGLIVFTFIFEFGADPTQQGPGLIFISLTTLFAKLGLLGNILAVAFFIALFFAGITSAISMIEPFTFYLINRYQISRKKALMYVGFIVYFLGSLSILSFYAPSSESLTFFGKSFFDILDFFIQNLLMPISALITAFFVGFVLKKETLQNLFNPYMKGIFFEIWYIFLRFISPLAVIVIMARQIFF